jgi:hypothetical protein
MVGSVDEVRKLLSHPSPGFRCHPPGSAAQRKYVARVAHLLGDPAPKEHIVEIKKKFPSLGDQLASFYERHNGFILYRDLLSEAAGVRLLPVHEWEVASAELLTGIEHIPDDDDPDCIKSGIPIAEVPHSGNYLVLSVNGPSAGKVFYADHDGWYEAPFANDFDGFIVRVCHDPVLLLNEVFGCYTRYSDGHTDTQWIPEEYFANVGEAR